MKLISMTDFVLEQSHLLSEIPKHQQLTDAYFRSLHYANFLKQPLTLSMFVPCDEEDNLLNPCGCSLDKGRCKKEDEYQKAKEKVLFEGFSVEEDKFKDTKRKLVWFNDNMTQLWRQLTYRNGRVVESFLPNNYNGLSCVEDIISMNLTLTETAIKQIGL